MANIQFLEFMVECGALLFGDFTLKSGRKSPYFVNTGEYKFNQQIGRLGDFYAQMIEKSGIEFDVLYGPAYKGIPLAVITADRLKRKVGVSFNRKEEKTHGDGKAILGYVPKAGDRVAIIEDVTTAGTSVRETLDILGKDVEVVALYISIDRMEKGTRDTSAVQQIEQEYKIPVYSIATARDIIDYLGDSEYAVKMREYLEQYGVSD
ncbi:MAG: orotate phosphoribosyltransferase [Oscillospiraceae bacterium]|nr:orotate phosphoribosyltransferase [Oscillospiraceae bacterium]